MLQASALTFSTLPPKGSTGLGVSAGAAGAVHGPLKTTVVLLEQEGQRVCLVASHQAMHTFFVWRVIRETVSHTLHVPWRRVLVCSSHNHCAVPLSCEHVSAFWAEGTRRGNPDLTPTGLLFMKGLRAAVKQLLGRLQPVSVACALGKEGRITYNRKGRHDDGTTYFMREEDRLLLGRDFRGEIDEDAPVVALRGQDGRPVCFLVQFTGHPATGYHPEHPVVCGEYPQTACDLLSRQYSPGREVPVAFLQGCAGNINSKGLLTGDVERSVRQGRRLGKTYVRASRRLKASATDRLGFATEAARVPYKPLPSPRALAREIAEIEDFRRRALAGDENTLSCVGLNFPRALSPKYRADLIKPALNWNRWAMRLHDSGRAGFVPTHQEMDVWAVRLGDVGIAAMTSEPFMDIGRQIKRNSPFELTIPCGYTNVSYGYIPDGANAGDREYISAFYRYTRYRPPYRKPAGDMLARTGAALLQKLYEE